MTKNNIKRTFEEIEASCQRNLDIIAEHAGEGATVMLCPANLSGRECSEAREVEEMEFLVAEAPLMPLPDCVAPSQCMCVYSIRKLGIQR